jgi:mRNA-degrading endonuclease RelE of RelBE toxin-antitoxin system
MEYIMTKTFKRSIKKLNISKKIKKNILSDFDIMTPEETSQQPYLHGKYKMYKKYRRSSYRILFSYCLECYGKYNHFFNCAFCDRNNLSLIVLHDIHNRKFDYY